MKTFTFEMSLTDAEIENLHAFLVDSGVTSTDSNKTLAAHAFISRKVEQLYVNVSADVKTYLTRKALEASNTETETKVITSKIVDGNGNEIDQSGLTDDQKEALHIN